MSAVLEAREPSAKYLSTLQQPLVPHFEMIATAPGGIAKLRELILTLAVQGKLVPQDPSDEPAGKLLTRSRIEMRDRMDKGVAKKEKASADVSEDELPFAMPSGWQACRLTDTGEYVNGLAFKPSDFKPEGLPVIRIQNLSGRSSEFNRARGEFQPSVLVSAGDILVSWSATLDAFIWHGENAVLNQHIFRVEPSPAVDKGYLYWLLKWAIRDLATSDHAHGLVMSHINRGPFLAKPIGLPPLAEQSCIVTRVEELMRLCDALEAKGQLEAAQHAELVQTLLGALTASTSPKELADNWQRVAIHFDLLIDRPESIDALEQTILQLAVRGLLVHQDPKDEPAHVALCQLAAERSRLIAAGAIKATKQPPEISEQETPFNIPASWGWAPLANLVRVLNGRAYSKQELLDRGPTPVLRVGNLFTSNHWYFSDLELEPDKLCQPGDLLFAWSASFGPFIWDGPTAIFHYHIWKLDPIAPELFNSKYIHTFLLEQTAEIKAAGHGVSMVHMTKEKMEKIPVPWPPLAEQDRIVTRVEELMRLCADLRQSLAARQTIQAHLAEALIDEVA